MLGFLTGLNEKIVVLTSLLIAFGALIDRIYARRTQLTALADVGANALINQVREMDRLLGEARERQEKLERRIDALSEEVQEERQARLELELMHESEVAWRKRLQNELKDLREHS